jgi:hypothetical protein
MSARQQEFLAGLETEGAAQATAQQRAYERRKLRLDQQRVNNGLRELGRQYWASVPLDTVNALLLTYGFDELEPMILCGATGRLHENVGRDRWLALTWYKMESGRYEVVAYVS